VTAYRVNEIDLFGGFDCLWLLFTGVLRCGDSTCCCCVGLLILRSERREPEGIHLRSGWNAQEEETLS
jgi:hypothetical protein